MSGGLGVIKDCYEAYAVYTFFSFLVAVLKGVKVRGSGSTGLPLQLLAP